MQMLDYLVFRSLRKTELTKELFLYTNTEVSCTSCHFVLTLRLTKYTFALCIFCVA